MDANITESKDPTDDEEQIYSLVNEFITHQNEIVHAGPKCFKTIFNVKILQIYIDSGINSKLYEIDFKDYLFISIITFKFLSS